MRHLNKAGVLLVIDEPEKKIEDTSSVSIGSKRVSVTEIPLIYKICTICNNPFSTTRKNKNICSLPCKMEHNRQRARYYARMRRNKPKVYEPCIVCDFSETTDKHHENGKEYILCPNHHCLITRNIKSLSELLNP